MISARSEISISFPNEKDYVFIGKGQSIVLAQALNVFRNRPDRRSDFVSSIKLKIRLSWKSGNVELPAAEGLLWKNGSMFSPGVVNFEFQNVQEIVIRSG